MATLEQLQQALINADAAGDTEAATVFAREIVNMKGAQGAAQSAPQTSAPQAEAAPTSYWNQIGSGINEGFAGIAGFPVDTANAAMGLGLAGANAAFGTDLRASDTPFLGSKWIKDRLDIAPPSQDTGQQMARKVAQSVGASSIPVGYAAKTLGGLASGLATALGGGVSGAVAEQAFPDSPMMQAAAEMLGSAATGSSIATVANSLARQRAIAAVPSVAELRSQATDLYRQAEQRGIVADPGRTYGLAAKIGDIARNEELITPTGRISTAYPRAAEAMNLLSDYAGYPMNPTQMQVIRDTLADARNSTQGKERRIAEMMLREFDAFTAPLAPELTMARELSHRAFKGADLERMADLADARAGNFTASGKENAVRTEYRQLDRAITKGQERGWSKDEVDAIQKVSRGTSAQNAARNVGRMAPTGPVSFATTAGVPFLIGNAIGGPSVGAALAGAASGIGYGGRAIASGMQKRNVEIAEALARSGGQFKYGAPDDVINSIIAALSSQGAGN